ncbi:MAG: 3-phosphoshikimate 1-carboxyvinyltransferase [Clostridia bacterium]|nr:3-phosphoshikimate 1-carboxyvinyltransferase [Clostridia bacterium]
MYMSIFCANAQGKINAIASKSVAHRLLICAAFADMPTRIRCDQTNKDIEATAACLSALGARIERNTPYYDVTPVDKNAINKNAALPCNESGSTLRFLLPVAAALGADSLFVMNGRLPDRPLSPLREELEAHSVVFFEKNPLRINGTLTGNEFSIDGGVSSQFVSGLLFALSLLDHDCKLTVNGNIESAPYIDITCDALALFGAPVKKDGNTYIINAKGRLISPREIEVEGDWSNAAFPLALGILKGKVEVSGLNCSSSQGDMAIVDILKAFGGNVSYCEESGAYIACKSSLTGTDIDASQIPDLVPVLATVATVAQGTTRIYGAARLRLKESDRIQSTYAVLRALGADITETADGLMINGVEKLCGSDVDSYNDHRIAMSVAVASALTEDKIHLSGAEAVTKSYPDFWKDMRSLGLICDQT